MSWLQSPSAVTLEPPKIKSVTVSLFPHLCAMKGWDQMPCSFFFECWVLSQFFHSPLSPSVCREVMRPNAMILVFWMLSFKSDFLLSSFTFIKRLFSSSLLSTVRMVPSTYLKLLIFLLAILIPDCASFSPAFHMMYFAYKWQYTAFSVYVQLKPSLKDFEHNFASMWNEHNCAVVWTFFGVALLWDWNENWLFQSCDYYWVF